MLVQRRLATIVRLSLASLSMHARDCGHDSWATQIRRTVDFNGGSAVVRQHNLLGTRRFGRTIDVCSTTNGVGTVMATGAATGGSTSGA